MSFFPRRSELAALRDKDLATRRDDRLRVLMRRSKADPIGACPRGFTWCKTAEPMRLAGSSRRGDRWALLPDLSGQTDQPRYDAIAVRRVAKTAAVRTGHGSYECGASSGHPQCVGAARDLLVKGLDTAAIIRADGWKSLGVLARYLEKAQQTVWGRGQGALVVAGRHRSRCGPGAIARSQRCS